MSTKVVWVMLRRNNRFLLAQRAEDDVAGGTWCFPGGKIDPGDTTPIYAAHRELLEEVGVHGRQFRKLCDITIDKYITSVWCCNKWSGDPIPSCDDIIGVGWFTLAEIHKLDETISPFLGKALMYISYLTQHYDHNPQDWSSKLLRFNGYG